MCCSNDAQNKCVVDEDKAQTVALARLPSLSFPTYVKPLGRHGGKNALPMSPPVRMDIAAERLVDIYT